MHHHINFSTPCCSSTAWSCIISLLRGSCIRWPLWPCARPTWGLSPTSICGTISSTPGYYRVQTQKRWCWALWTFLSDPGLELFPTSVFQCLTLRLGGGEYGSFRGTTLTRRSPWSRVVTPSLNPNGGTLWLGDTSAGCNPYMMSSSSCYEVDWSARTSYGPLSTVASKRSVGERWPCGCIWGWAVLTVPSLQRWMVQRSALMLIHFSSTHTHSPVGSWVRTECPRGVTLPEDVVRREANRANNERQ
jgi:hypothetical protein